MKTAQAVAKARRSSTLVLLASRHLRTKTTAPHGADRESAVYANDIEVLMMRRHAKSRVMPDMYVFPGGGLEDQDLALARQHLGADRGDAANEEEQAARLAALRETTEETSLVLRPDSTLETAQSFLQQQQQQQQPYDPQTAAALLTLGHWTTPKTAKYRNATYFYSAIVQPNAAGTAPQEVQMAEQVDEVEGLTWIRPAEALQQHEDPAQKFMLPPPTFFLLHALATLPPLAEVAPVWQRAQQRAAAQPSTTDVHTYQSVTPVVKVEADHVKHIQIPDRYYNPTLLNLKLSKEGLPAVLEKGCYHYVDPALSGGLVTALVGGATEEDGTVFQKISH